MLILSPQGPLADFWPVPPTSHLRAVLHGCHWWWNQGTLDTTDFQPTVESPNLPNSPRPHGSKVLCNLSAIFPEFCWCEECPLPSPGSPGQCYICLFVTHSFSWGAQVSACTNWFGRVGEGMRSWGLGVKGRGGGAGKSQRGDYLVGADSLNKQF